MIEICMIYVCSKNILNTPIFFIFGFHFHTNTSVQWIFPTFFCPFGRQTLIRAGKGHPVKIFLVMLQKSAGKKIPETNIASFKNG